MVKIMLDAGHGYSTPGKRTPDGMREYEFNRAVANYAKAELLTYQNTEVFFAHSDSRDVPLQERTDLANRLKVDVYVSAHANAYGTGDWTSPSGVETFVHPVIPNETLVIATAIHNHLIRDTGRRNRGVKRADFHVLRETDMHAVLVECGFMTNQEEAALLKTEAYRKRCALAIVKGLVEHYKLVKKPAPKPTAPTTGKLYKVQVGAFADKKNAERLADELNKKGYSTYIVHE